MFPYVKVVFTEVYASIKKLKFGKQIQTPKKVFHARGPAHFVPSITCIAVSSRSTRDLRGQHETDLCQT